MVTAPWSEPLGTTADPKLYPSQAEPHRRLSSTWSSPGPLWPGPQAPHSVNLFRESVCHLSPKKAEEVGLAWEGLCKANDLTSRLGQAHWLQAWHLVWGPTGGQR